MKCTVTVTPADLRAEATRIRGLIPAQIDGSPEGSLLDALEQAADALEQIQKEPPKAYNDYRLPGTFQLKVNFSQ